ncbi:MAG TPA: hypothetical protein VNW72_02780 [Chthoniobacterales bacterium]|jgi:hypothetical protein|nr:hypothetical protein [Chthoniobacterales bacterium]
MNTATTTPLLFNWEAPRGRNLAIIGFLVASLASHAAGFYLFQIVYPPTVSLTPAPQRVNLISANSEQGATLLRWIDAEDPALASTTRKAPEAKRYLLGKVQHIPSYFAREPALQQAPPLTVDLRVPSAQPPGPVPAPLRARSKSIGVVPTKVNFSNELDPLGPPKFVSTNFKSSTREPPQNAQFRIAVDAGGAILYCFSLTSSGDAALDEQARAHLALCRFPPRSTSAGDSLEWGIATVEWGNDIVEPGAKPTPTTP